MKVTCEVYGLEFYTGPMILEAQESVGDRVHIKIKDAEITVHGRELVKAIQNCINN